MEPVTIGLVSGLSTFVVGLSYIILKRLARSNCASHNSCFECESPAVQLADLKRHTTERLDKIMLEIRELKPEPQPGELRRVPLP